VIIVTAYIVKPSSKKLKAPNEMIPRMYAPLEVLLTRKFHKNVKKHFNAGFSIK
jgi:Flp pilus assembly secretin CpaC